MFVVTVDFRIKPPHIAPFRAAVLRQAKNSMTREIDCKRFDVLLSPDDDCAVFLYEEYTDKAAFDTHCKTKHFQEFSDTVAAWVEDKRVACWQPMESE